MNTSPFSLSISTIARSSLFIFSSPVNCNSNYSPTVPHATTVFSFSYRTPHHYRISLLLYLMFLYIILSRQCVTIREEVRCDGQKSGSNQRFPIHSDLKREGSNQSARPDYRIPYRTSISGVHFSSPVDPHAHTIVLLLSPSLSCVPPPTKPITCKESDGFVPHHSLIKA